MRVQNQPRLKAVPSFKALEVIPLKRASLNQFSLISGKLSVKVKVADPADITLADPAREIVAEVTAIKAGLSGFANMANGLW